MVFAVETTEEDRTMLNDFFSGIGFVVLFLIAIALAVIAIGFKVLLWVVGIVLGGILIYAIIKASWYWICRLVVWVLPQQSRHYRWFQEQCNKYR